MYPLVQLPKKLKEKSERGEAKCLDSFPLVQLPKKLKDITGKGTDGYGKSFPLVQLPKKLKEPDKKPFATLRMVASFH